MNKVKAALKLWQEARDALVVYRKVNENLNLLVLQLDPIEYKYYLQTTSQTQELES